MNRRLPGLIAIGALIPALLAAAGSDTLPTATDDARTVAALDTAYQAAVARNDATAMAGILHPDFVLVVGNGNAYTREQLLESARNRDAVYTRQVEDPGTQTVRVFAGKNGADTAVVTALLWLQGTRDGGKTAFDRKLWFSDTYVRTRDGWKYAFGQASLALPAAATSPRP